MRDKERIARCDCMHVCVKQRDGVALQSFGGHNKLKETQGHRKMNTVKYF